MGMVSCRLPMYCICTSFIQISLGELILASSLKDTSAAANFSRNRLAWFHFVYFFLCSLHLLPQIVHFFFPSNIQWFFFAMQLLELVFQLLRSPDIGSLAVWLCFTLKLSNILQLPVSSISVFFLPPFCFLTLSFCIASSCAAYVRVLCSLAASSAAFCSSHSAARASPCFWSSLFLNFLVLLYCGLLISQALSQNDWPKPCCHCLMSSATSESISGFGSCTACTEIVRGADQQNPWYPAGGQWQQGRCFHFHSKVSIFSALASASSRVSWRTSSSWCMRSSRSCPASMVSSSSLMMADQQKISQILSTLQTMPLSDSYHSRMLSAIGSCSSMQCGSRTKLKAGLTQ